MSVKRNSPLLEAAEALSNYRASFQQKQQQRVAEAAKERADMIEHITEAKERKMRERMAYREHCENLKTELLSEALMGIYVGALSEGTDLTDNGILLAKALVDNYIKESGGAQTVLNKCAGKTYALDFIRSVVEGTYEAILNEESDEDDDKEDKTEDSKSDDGVDDIETDENGETEITPQDTDGDGVEDKLEEVPVDGDEKSSSEKKSEMFDDLEKDSDISNAVQVIAKRITDAEEEFIRKNNEDKQALEDIAQKFSERIKKVENDNTVDEEEKENLQQESSRMARRLSNDRRESRTRNVFEQVVINLTESILKDENLMVQYAENGKLDMGSVVESAKCIYGFLETVNTLQLNRVDAKYIEEALATM